MLREVDAQKAERSHAQKVAARSSFARHVQASCRVHGSLPQSAVHYIILKQPLEYMFSYPRWGKQSCLQADCQAGFRSTRARIRENIFLPAHRYPSRPLSDSPRILASIAEPTRNLSAPP